MSLPTFFIPIVPAGNGVLYSAYPSGTPSQPVWATIPNFLNETTSLSVNIATTYLTPTSGVTITLTGTLPTGWTFNGTTLSYNGTSVNATASTISFTASYDGNTPPSNSFQIQGSGSSSSDTFAPTVPVGTTVTSNTVAGGIVLGGITPSDTAPNGYTWSGLQQLNVTRNGSSLGHTTIGPGNKPTLTFADIGPQTSTITQSGADVTFTTSAQDNPYPTVDCCATAFQQVTGTSWWASCKISSFTAADGYSNVGLFARASLGQTSAFAGIITFPFSQGNGVLSKSRATTGGNDTTLQTAANSTRPLWLFVNRNGNVFSFYYSTDGNTLTSLGSVTIAMGSTVYVGGQATTDNGVSITVTMQQLSIQTLANWSYTDTTVVPGTAYTYSVTSQDVAGNVSASGTSIAVTAQPSGSTLVNWASGLGREDAAQTRGYGSNYTLYDPPQDLASFITTPSYCTVYCPNTNWGCFESSTQGTYDFTLFEYIYNQCAPAGKYVLMFVHGEAVPGVSAATAYSQQYLPSYLNDNPGANVFGGLQNIYFGNSFGGVVPMLGRSAVINAFCNMIIAMCNHTMTTGANAGTQVKNLPYFLGVVTWETAYNLGQSGYPNWTGIDSSWGTNQQNWFNNYAQIVIPSLRNAIPNVLFVSRANFNGGGGASQLIPIAQAALTYKWALGGGTDFTASPTDMDTVINGTVGGVDYRPSLPMVEFTESVAGGTYGDNYNSNSPWSFSSTAASMIQAMQQSNLWNASILLPSRYTNDVWTNSTYSELQSAYVTYGEHLAQTTAPSGFQAGPF